MVQCASPEFPLTDVDSAASYNAPQDGQLTSNIFMIRIITNVPKRLLNWIKATRRRGRSAPFIHARDFIASPSADQSNSRVGDVRPVCASANLLHLAEPKVGRRLGPKRNFSA